MTHAPRAERHKAMTNENLFGEVIFTYSRAQAIEDGVLMDLSHVDSIREHWKFPFACTSTVWTIIEAALKREGEDLSGICHDISVLAHLAIPTGRDTNEIRFKVIIAGRTHTLKLHLGPGDTSAPVLTLMLPHED